MLEINNYKYLLKDLSELKGVGKKTSTLLKKKKILTIFDLLWRLPQSYIDRSESNKINNLQIGKIQTIKINVIIIPNDIFNIIIK